MKHSDVITTFLSATSLMQNKRVVWFKLFQIIRLYMRNLGYIYMQNVWGVWTVLTFSFLKDQKQQFMFSLSPLSRKRNSICFYKWQANDLFCLYSNHFDIKWTVICLSLSLCPFLCEAILCCQERSNKICICSLLSGLEIEINVQWTRSNLITFSGKLWVEKPLGCLIHS